MGRAGGKQNWVARCETLKESIEKLKNENKTNKQNNELIRVLY